MIIVSQNKKRTTESTELFIDTIIQSDKKSTYGIFVEKTDSAYIKLGEYETEERAKEVLQELISRIVLTERFEAICIPERQDNMVIDMYDNNRPLFIYEMPKE